MRGDNKYYRQYHDRDGQVISLYGVQLHSAVYNMPASSVEPPMIIIEPTSFEPYRLVIINETASFSRQTPMDMNWSSLRF